MGKDNCVLHPPEGLQAIHGFYYKKNQIILLYSTSSRDDTWIKIYKDNHTNNNDIINWCNGQSVEYQLLDKKNSRLYEAFMKEKLNRDVM